MNKTTKLLLIIIPIILILSVLYNALQKEFIPYYIHGIEKESILDFKKVLESELKITKIDSSIELLDKRNTDDTSEEYDKTHTSIIIAYKDYYLPTAARLREKSPDDVFKDVLYSNSNKVLTYKQYEKVSKNLLIEQTYFSDDCSYIILFPQKQHTSIKKNDSGKVDVFIDFKLLDIKHDNITNEIVIYIESEYEEGKMPTEMVGSISYDQYFDSTQIAENLSIKIIPVDNSVKLVNNPSIKIIEVEK